MGPDELLDRLRTVETERRRSEAEVALLVGALDRTGAYRADGHASVRGLLRSEVNWSEGDITVCLREARLVADAPMVGDALWTGEIGVAQARLLARVRANPRCGALLAAHVGDLVGIAGRLPYEDFPLCARRWEQLADTDGAHRRAETVHNERTASFTEHDGIGHLSATGGGCRRTPESAHGRPTRSARFRPTRSARFRPTRHAAQSELGRLADVPSQHSA